jgi:alpha-galactosidase
VLGIAHAMAGSSNLKAAGYEYLNLDAGVWSVNRTAAGELQANPIKFPSGLRSLSSKIHALGLKLGLYINLGTHLASCGRTGSYGRYEQDAATLAKVGVDFVKVD